MAKRSQTITIEYECCGSTYRRPTVLKSDSLLLANATLGDQIIAETDALHDHEHPECAR